MPSASENTEQQTHKGDLPLQIPPPMRLHLVRQYAIEVFGKEAAASAWLGRVSPSVLNGSCVVSTACLTSEGFQEAMVELHRISESRTGKAYSSQAPAGVPPRSPR